ncbi:MAG: hypothetical protein ACW99A_02815 [Candidatus Kariarchaeaceae archaeon]|jgi:uncharacterized membrane protein
MEKMKLFEFMIVFIVYSVIQIWILESIRNESKEIKERIERNQREDDKK